MNFNCDSEVPAVGTGSTSSLYISISISVTSLFSSHHQHISVFGLFVKLDLLFSFIVLTLCYALLKLSFSLTFVNFNQVFFSIREPVLCFVEIRCSQVFD